MAQVINPGERQDNELAQALSIAERIFGVVMDQKQKKAAESLAQKRLDADIEANKIETAEKQRSSREKFNSDYVPVSQAEIKQYENQGIKLPVIPGSDAPSGINLPEGKDGFVNASILAEERDRNKKLAQIAKSERDAAGKDEFDRTQKLSDDYTKISQDTRKALDGFKRVEAAANQPANGASDLALIFGFMKTIDPGSTVREGEFANAENSQGIPEYLRSQYNKILDGQRLTPESRQKFVDAAKAGMLSQLDTQSMVDERFAASAKKFGVDPAYVVNPIFSQLRERLTGGPNTEIAGSNSNAKGGFGTAIAEPSTQPFDPDSFLRGR